VYIDVLPPTDPNSTQATDDYAQTPYGKKVNGNVKTNDRDPEGDDQKVTPQTTTITGKGTLTLNDDGTFEFVPVPGFTGPIDFPYTTCDIVTLPIIQACANATLHIMVMPIPDLTPVFTFRSTVLSPGQSTNVICDVNNLLLGVADPTKSIISLSIAKPPASSGYSYTSNGTMTSITIFGSETVNNTDWDFVETSGSLIFTLKPGKTIRYFSRIGFTVKRANSTNTANRASVTAVILPGSGGELNNSNNTIGANVKSN